MLNSSDLMKWEILGDVEYGYYYDDHYGIGEGDIEFLLTILGSKPKSILEVCCGSGRIFIPLAKAGHIMTGFDQNIGMLARLHEKARSLTDTNRTNCKYYYADALTTEWETGFDIVLLPFNVIQNIECVECIENGNEAQEEINYINAQKTLITKSAKSLKQGGYFYLTFELFDKTVGENVFNSAPDPKYFIDPEEIDMSDAEVNIWGVRSKSISGGNSYNTETRMARGIHRSISIYPPNGEKIISEGSWFKHNLSLEEIRSWLSENGLEIVHEYGGYNGEPIKENEYNGSVVFWARKI